MVGAGSAKEFRGFSVFPFTAVSFLDIALRVQG